MLIYKVFRADEWAALEADGETLGAPVDLADGYVHFSTADQLAETLRRHFAGEPDLWLLAVDADAAGHALAGSPRAAAPSSRTSTARSPRRRALGAPLAEPTGPP